MCKGSENIVYSREYICYTFNNYRLNTRLPARVGVKMAKGFGQIDFKEVWTIPNIITYFRILCVPVFCALMALGGVRDNLALFYSALGVFFVASGSDLVDGYIARRFNMQSGIGMALDPVADKLMHISVLLCLALCTGLTPLGAHYNATGNPEFNYFVHYGFVVAIIAKELVQLMIAIYVIKKGATVKANWLGKISSFTISIGVILGFFHQYVGFADWGILSWGIVLSYAAAFSYLKQVTDQVKKIEKGEMEAATAESVKEEDQKEVAEGKAVGLGAPSKEQKND